jgi:DNA-binding transcriptional MerR regulator
VTDIHTEQELPESVRPEFPYRMKDLCERTGLPRQVIHFYIQQGLVPEGHKTSRNMAYYGESHVQRVLTVRRLQHERFLPLKAIKALLDQRDYGLSAPQRRLLGEVNSVLRAMGGADERAGEAKRVSVAEIMYRKGIDRLDFDELVILEFFGVSMEQGIETMLAADVWIVELWVELRQAGLSRERGFSPRDLQPLLVAVKTIFDHETRILAERMSGADPTMLANLVRKALPIINSFFSQLHAKRVGEMLDVVDEPRG